MDKDFLTFDRIEIEKKKKRFYGHKTSIFWGDVNIQKVLVSNKISFGEKIVRTLLVTCTMVIKLNH